LGHVGLTRQKTYKKVIVSGNVIEVYEYEKDPVIAKYNKYADDGFDPFDYDNCKLDSEQIKKDRTKERREQTVRDARNMVRRLALMNFGSGDKFITLTYKENMRDINKSDSDFKNFIKRFKYHFKIDSLKYIAVREFQKRGAVHYHVICNWDKRFESEKEVRHYERVLGRDIWRHGFVDIKTMDNNNDNVGAYLVKYMTKNVSVVFFKNRKIYLCSKGLERPKVYRGLEAEMIIEAYGLGDKKEVFTSSYLSEYLGNIVYKEYNLKRKS
jgi:hypothetical protein